MREGTSWKYTAIQQCSYCGCHLPVEHMREMELFDREATCFVMVCHRCHDNDSDLRDDRKEGLVHWMAPIPESWDSPQEKRKMRRW